MLVSINLFSLLAITILHEYTLPHRTPPDIEIKSVTIISPSDQSPQQISISPLLQMKLQQKQAGLISLEAF